MVLTLFAVVHHPDDKVADRITLTSSSKDAKSKTPKLLIWHKQHLFDEMLSPIDTGDLTTEQPVILAVSPGITMAEMINFNKITQASISKLPSLRMNGRLFSIPSWKSSMNIVRSHNHSPNQRKNSFAGTILATLFFYDIICIIAHPKSHCFANDNQHH